MAQTDVRSHPDSSEKTPKSESPSTSVVEPHAPPSTTVIAIYILGILGLLALAAAIIIAVYIKPTVETLPNEDAIPTTSTPAPPPILTVTPTPTPIALHSGKGIYTVSQSKHVGATINQVVFDPLDVQKGQTLTITVSMSNSVPISEVTGLLQMDHTKKTLSFEKIAGDRVSEWKSSLVLEDTVRYRYILTISTRSENGSSVVTVAPRS